MTATDVSGALGDLLDRAAVREVLTRYCRAADRCDQEFLRGCYHAGTADRHGPFAGSADAFATRVVDRQRTTSITTQHAVSNVVIELAGDTAWVESAFTATHVRPASNEGPGDGPFIDTFWGRYVDRFDRRGGTWAITTRKVVHDWSERRAAGPPMPAVATYAAGRRDRDDISYRREVAS
jgi:hypothetical protein